MPLIAAEGVRGSGAPEQMLGPVSSLPGRPFHAPQLQREDRRPRRGDGHMEVTGKWTPGSALRCPQALSLDCCSPPGAASQRIVIELGDGKGERDRDRQAFVKRDAEGREM